MQMMQSFVFLSAHPHKFYVLHILIQLCKLVRTTYWLCTAIRFEYMFLIQGWAELREHL